MATANKKELGFEKALEKLEQIVNKLEGGDLTLDKALENFKEGVELSNYCSGKLDLVQKEVMQVVEQSKTEYKLKKFTEDEE